MPISWSQDLSVGVKEIDEQHKVFVGILSDLYNLMFKGATEPEMSSLIKQLESYTTFHFATEERYFDKFNYEFSDEHKREHRELEARVADFKVRLKNEGEVVLSELLDFLENWLVEHLEIQDKKYTTCFNNHGLA